MEIRFVFSLLGYMGIYQHIINLLRLDLDFEPHLRRISSKFQIQIRRHISVLPHQLMFNREPVS